MNFIASMIAITGLSLGVMGPHDAAQKQAGEKEGGACPLCASHSEQASKELPKVDAAEYTKAQWPEHNTGDSLYANDFQGKALPAKLGKETWLTEKHDLAGKVLVLDFWATWCGPCRAAAPKLAELQAGNKENLAVVAIAGQREEEETVRAYLAKHEEPVHQLFDAQQTVFREFESKGIPLVVVISTDGVVRWIGNPHDPNFEPAVEQVLKVDPLISAKG